MANYEHYKIFCKIVECKSISKAASQLYVSQPAVSLAVKQLESNLNVQLFFRTQKGVTLTAEGEVLYNYVKQGCNIINIGEEKMKELTQLKSGEISIGASDMTLRFFLLPYIEEFHKNYPSVKIRITNATTPETLKHLKEGMIDFGVVSAPVESAPSLSFKNVKSVKDILVVGEAFRELSREPQVSLHDLQKYPFIMLEKGTSTRKYIEKFFAEHNVEIIPEIELATSDLIVDFVKRGIGIGFILEDFVSNDLDNGNLYRVNLNPDLLSRQFYIVTHANIPLTTAAKKLIESTE
jgi:DNA-binding transcriptional LysR family regulator